MRDDILPSAEIASQNDGTNWRALHPIRTPEYDAWSTMKYRCNCATSASYRNYGGRGIRVCDEWNRSFKAFLRDVGPRPSKEHSIDRINNSGNYEPGNVRWATKAEQGRNRRTNVMVTYGGITLCIKDWSKITGLHRTTIGKRLCRGQSLEEVLRPVSDPPLASRLAASTAVA